MTSPGTSDPVEPDKTHLVREIKLDRPLIACRFHPTGRYVFASAEDRTVRRWDLESEAEGEPPSATFTGHDSWVFSLAPHPDGDSLVTCGGDGRVMIWPAVDPDPAPTPRHTLLAHEGWVRSASISPNGEWLATAGNDRIVRLWSFADGQPILELPGHERPIYWVTFDPAGESLLTADLQGRVIQWDPRAGKEMRRLDASQLYSYNQGQEVDYGGVRELAFCPGVERIACCGLINASNPLGAVNNPAVVVIDRASEEPTSRVLKPKEDVNGVAWGLRYHPDGFLIVVSGGTGGGYLWFFRPEGESENEFASLKLGNTGRGLDLHPDGRRIAVAHHDSALRLYAMTAKPEA